MRAGGRRRQEGEERRGEERRGEERREEERKIRTMMLRGIKIVLCTSTVLVLVITVSPSYHGGGW